MQDSSPVGPQLGVYLLQQTILEAAVTRGVAKAVAPLVFTCELSMIWFQQQVTLSPYRRGCHLVTREVLTGIPEIAKIGRGLCHVFIQHTSASLTLNENADPDVRTDMETALNHLCPENLPFVHTLEGADDMPAHVKASLMGSSLSLPIANGQLGLGTWQGIYLCEHRNRGGRRRLIVTGFGEPIQ